MYNAGRHLSNSLRVSRPIGFDIQLAPPMKMLGRPLPAELSKRAEDLRHLLPFLVTLGLCKTAGVGIPCVSDAPKVMSDCPHVDEE